MEKGHFYRFMRVLTFTVNTAFSDYIFSDLTDKILTINSHGQFLRFHIEISLFLALP